MKKTHRLVNYDQEKVPASLYYDVFQTRLGWFVAVASDKGLRYGSLRATPQEAVEDTGRGMSNAQLSPDALRETRELMQAFLAGKGNGLDQIELDMDDAPTFHKKAWETCRSIPLGETRSYAWLAAMAGRPGAYRAAGQAMARNRVPIVVPCHRVIGSDGGLHGYGGGLSVKAELLRMEAVLLQRKQSAG